ncbi:hypothetical protein ACHAXN_003292 [Cyclotella atomus]
MLRILNSQLVVSNSPATRRSSSETGSSTKKQAEITQTMSSNQYKGAPSPETIIEAAEEMTGVRALHNRERGNGKAWQRQGSKSPNSETY